ncbi:hypothetical protein K503DRAFT_781943 [Rhizopogon vinicolor AM-OR11-026]|uniref:Ricin B lectin domain-containing protein n=1 Tax=Rhizopogon vinicolor AM-OR11-026 TaxID=1314800 RepID=A0A1B7N4F9_9AGAM|nr:hypothetical protein K503DRAFT_781943 [Rhizopogon vinicolor AM-OR11-026]
MTVQDVLPTGTYTIRNASTNEYIAVQGPVKVATLIGSRDGSAENTAWVLERLSGHRDKYNIRSFAQNSCVTINSAQKTNGTLAFGREACPWSIRATGYGTHVRKSRISPHSDASLYWSLIKNAGNSQALLTDDRTSAVHWYLHRMSA